MYIQFIPYYTMFTLTITTINISDDENMYDYNLTSRAPNCNIVLSFSAEPMTAMAMVTKKEVKLVITHSNGPRTQIELSLIDDVLNIMYRGDPGNLTMKYILNEEQIISFKDCITKVSNHLLKQI